MWKSTTAMLLALAITFPLYGCGGGGGSDDGGSSSGSTSTGTTASPAITLSTIQIAPENSLTSVYEVEVDVILPHLAASQAYISICDNSGGGLESIDYEKCLVKAALESGAGQYSLRVPNHCDSLIAVVSVMEPNTSPLVYELNHNNQALTTWLIQ